MNNQRRNKLKKIIDILNDAMNMVEFVRDEEEEYMNNIPENLQGSERYSIAEEACNYLEDAISDIESAIENLDDAQM